MYEETCPLFYCEHGYYDEDECPHCQQKQRERESKRQSSEVSE